MTDLYKLKCGAVVHIEGDMSPCPDPYCRLCRDETGEVADPPFPIGGVIDLETRIDHAKVQQILRAKVIDGLARMHGHEVKPEGECEKCTSTLVELDKLTEESLARLKDHDG